MLSCHQLNLITSCRVCRVCRDAVSPTVNWRIAASGNLAWYFLIMFARVRSDSMLLVSPFHCCTSVLLFCGCFFLTLCLSSLIHCSGALCLTRISKETRKCAHVISLTLNGKCSWRIAEDFFHSVVSIFELVGLLRGEMKALAFFLVLVWHCVTCLLFVCLVWWVD